MELCIFQGFLSFCNDQFTCGKVQNVKIHGADFPYGMLQYIDQKSSVAYHYQYGEVSLFRSRSPLICCLSLLQPNYSGVITISSIASGLGKYIKIKIRSRDIYLEVRLGYFSNRKLSFSLVHKSAQISCQFCHIYLMHLQSQFQFQYQQDK